MSKQMQSDNNHFSLMLGLVILILIILYRKERLINNFDEKKIQLISLSILGYIMVFRNLLIGFLLALLYLKESRVLF